MASERRPHALPCRAGRPGGRAALVAAAVALSAAMLDGRDARGVPIEIIGGTRDFYGNIPPDQIEFLSTVDRMRDVIAAGSPTDIWETLEHAERVECIGCVPTVEPLLYASAPSTREIAAWWLRRRLFGVWGKGETYERTLEALASAPDPRRRRFAAEALGEFLARPGVEACATAIGRDADAEVRAAAATALGRLNDDGGGALSKALADADARVKLAALGAIGRLHAFEDVPSLVRAMSDGDARVRRRAAEVLGARRAEGAVDGLIALTRDADSNVRNAGAHALGEIRDGRARGALEGLASDPDGLVRDQAKMALGRL